MTTKAATVSTAPKPASGRKSKSPAAPSYNLRESTDNAQTLYKNFTHGEFTKPELASALGISMAAGATVRRIFTLKEFGLISLQAGKCKVTDEYIAQQNTTAGSPEFKQATYSAILRVKLFRELIQSFNSKLPATSTVAVRLEQQKKFNPDRAKEIAVILEESLKFATVVDGSGNIIAPREVPGGKVPHKKIDGVPEIKGRDVDGDVEGDEEVDLDKKLSFLRCEVPLKETRKAIVSYPADLSSEEAIKIGKVLAALVG